jgi:hypothetical protein
VLAAKKNTGKSVFDMEWIKSERQLIKKFPAFVVRRSERQLK